MPKTGHELHTTQGGTIASAMDKNDGPGTEGGDGRAHGSATKTRGRGKAWLPEENLGVVLASIDGANMRSVDYEQKVHYVVNS
jgi:hypothetical protein